MVAVAPNPSSGDSTVFNAGNDGPWQMVGGRRRSRPVDRRPQPMSRFRELLFKKARGRCFKCLSPDHRVATCRNLACCLLCGESGHKARWCKGEKGEKVSSSVEELPTPVAPAASSGTWRRRTGPMEAPARCAEDRLVRAAAPRSAAIAEEERRLTRLGVVAVVVGWCPDLELPDVARAFARHFRLLEEAVQVTMLAPGEFLVIFSTVAARNAAVQWQGVVPFGRVSFMVSPWSRFRKATAGRLCYKVRVCIEGVPSSAHNWEAVKGLFDSSVIFDSVDNSLNSKEDSACFKVWVWMANVGSLARRGLLDLEEPLEVDSPLLHLPELGILADRPVRSGPVKTLSYNIILHLDRVLDFSGSPSSSPESHLSIHSDVSGLPSVTSSTPEFPVTWGYRWYLGPTADLLQLMDADLQPSQLDPVKGSPKGKEADVPGGAVETMQGHAGEGSQFEEKQAEKRAFVEATGMHGAGSDRPGFADQSKVDGAEDELFGPHSPRELLDQGGVLDNLAQPPAGPIQRDQDSERAVENQGLDPLQEFIVNHSTPVTPALLPSPLEATAAAKSGRSMPGCETAKKSTRLAAKPMVGLSTMEKINFVLLKKSGAPTNEAQPQGTELQRLADLYTKPLPRNFIKAATALVEAGSASKAFAIMEEGQVASA
ncbi:hypothetical protein ACQ4PT_037119 [Festuca glaucescens]